MLIPSMNSSLFLFFFLGLLMPLLNACSPPLNDFRLFNDTSLLPQILAEHGIDMNNPEQGSAEVVSNTISPHERWHAGMDPSTPEVTVIHWCYYSQVEINAIGLMGNHVAKAWERWHQKIGQASAESGHTLEFRLWKKMCTLDPAPGGIHRTWRLEVPKRTVVVRLARELDGGAQSTTGYIPEAWNNREGRHKLEISPSLFYSPPEFIQSILAHELGHIFGLWHEHQREDRDRYVHFECKNLNGYAEVAQRISDQKPSFTMAEMCESWKLGRDPNWSFPAPSFSTQTSRESSNVMWWETFPLQVTHSEKYDYDSIMHYASSQAMRPGNNGYDVKQAVLTKWKKPLDEGQSAPPVTAMNSFIMRGTGVPSDRDYEAIKRLYPWPSRQDAPPRGDKVG
ncbi:hypothetical protein P153DRAFT_392045 [Dothidotthia symphoricarpi CBS 119687]|uniref:Metalloendopeptidase n=1 Tax=Dothidotthia symphoricarpi CBS 119687 TaxID=1392245 RepID=A0A6A6AUV2_9PLEO|nr:uncharacterized protein P153DRAFT_392045 [Dothidotthia symphoricarpi CBS 119687]KAF2134724.1 hypothetical protein P153DRAFT_392045 [Dothidotthia symphoricarpi CBS 119687]